MLQLLKMHCTVVDNMDFTDKKQKQWAFNKGIKCKIIKKYIAVHKRVVKKLEVSKRLFLHSKHIRKESKFKQPIIIFYVCPFGLIWTTNISVVFIIARVIKPSLFE